MKYNKGVRVSVNDDVIMLNTRLPFIVTMVDPYKDGSKWYEVTNGYEVANIHESRLSPLTQ